MSESINQWLNLMRGEITDSMIIRRALFSEMPDFCTAVLQRKCDSSCRHCCYADDVCSKEFSFRNNLQEVIISTLRQIKKKHSSLPPSFAHIGRILEPWHVEMLCNIRKALPKIQIGIINNGCFVQHLKKIEQAGLKFNWIDISIDGTEHFHNLQRDPIRREGFYQAIKGMELARQVLADFGQLNAEFTATVLNYLDLANTAKMLLDDELVDFMDISMISPLRPQTKNLELRHTDFSIFWQQLKETFAKYNTTAEKRVFFQIYRWQDFDKIATAIGYKRMKKILSMDSTSQGDGLLEIKNGRLKISVDGVTVTYHPLSLWPQQAIFIDADAAYRTAFSQTYTLNDLQCKASLKPYTIDQLTEKSRIKDLYKRCVSKWWNNFGKVFLQEEFTLFQNILRGDG